MAPSQYNDDLPNLIHIATIYEASLKMPEVKKHIEELYERIKKNAEEKNITLGNYEGVGRGECIILKSGQVLPEIN